MTLSIVAFLLPDTEQSFIRNCLHVIMMVYIAFL